MASSVTTVFHGLAAGETFTPAELRSGLISRAGVVADSTVGKARPGILPGPSTPLDVKQAATPAMKVKVFAGTVIQQSADSPGGVYCHTLTADTELDIDTAPASNSRYDVIAAKVFDNGTAPTTSIVVLKGTAAVSPVLPTDLTTPAANTYYYPLARVTVGASVTSILNASIAKPAATGGQPTFGQFTAGPGAHIPVANLTAAAALPPYTPFYSIADRSTGIVPSSGTVRLDGHQHRYIHKQSAGTNSNGDIDPVTFGLYLAGVWTAAPFPNGCFGFTIQDASSIAGIDAPLIFKTGAFTAWPPTASSGIARVYQHDGTKYVSSLLDIQGIAWGW
jgi:hypothetical protein